MKSIEVSARTIEDAISDGLAKLGCAISDCKVECQFFILKIVLSDIHMITVTGNVMEWFVFDLDFFLCIFSADIAGVCELFFDFSKIIFCQCNIKCCLNGFQVSDLVQCLFAKNRKCFKSTFLLVIFCKITLGIFLRCL